MAVPLEDAVAALSTFSLEDDQPDVQGLSVILSTGRCATQSPIGYEDVPAYRLSLMEDTKSINQLNVLVQEGKEMAAVLYTYRSCVKALPQLPDSLKQSQADLYFETYQVLDLEISRLREIQRWQASAASKLAVDMQRFSRPERLINGPTITHMWSMLKLLDVLLELDHLKNAKASIPNDFSWYKRTFTQVSSQWQDTDSMREELDDLQIFLSTRWAILLNIQVELFRVNNIEDILQMLIIFCIESLETVSALLFSERHALLRVLPVLVVLATSSEKEGDTIFKKIKITRLINIFKRDPVIPAFPDLHLAPATMLKELSSYFQRFSSHSRLISLPAPHEIGPREALEYQRHYSVLHHIGMIRSEHDDFALRFAAAKNQLLLLKSSQGIDLERNREVKCNMYGIVVEGFQILSRWIGHVWEQCAWKFSRPSKDSIPLDPDDRSANVSDYEKVVRCNYSYEERRAMVELTSYIKGIGAMMQKSDTVIADALWEAIHAEVQDFVQNKLAIMLRTTFKKKKDLSRILSDMRTIAADWMANTIRPETHQNASRRGGDDNNGVSFQPRPVAPTAAQVHCLQFLIHELVSGDNPKKTGGLFKNNDIEIPLKDMRELEIFFHKLTFFTHILDYSATIVNLTDLGFLWFREFYLETSRVIQFPIECSLPWMLVDQIIESQDAGLLESLLMPFDIYNDSAQHALHVLKQRFLYDEIEAEVDLCFDQLVFKLSENIFAYYKSRAASKLLDPAFLFASDNADKYDVTPRRYDALFKMRRVKLLGRSIDLRYLIGQRMNKIFRENIDILFERFESQDICAVVELQQLFDVLRLTYQLLKEYLTMDPFRVMLNEMSENISLVSFSGRLASQIFAEMQNDFLLNFIFCNTTQRYIRSSKVCQRPIQRPPIPHAKSSFYCGSSELNMAYQAFAQLYSKFFGLPHMHAIVKLLGSRSLPWLVRALLDLLAHKITSLVPNVTELQESLPKSMGLLSFDGGVAGCLKVIQEQITWVSSYQRKGEVLHCLKEIGTMVSCMSLLDTVLREVETTQFMQIAPWLGILPGKDGQAQQILAEDGNSPVISLFKSATNAVISLPDCLSPSSFLTMCKQAEAADSFYASSIQTGSVLDYTLAFMSASLDTVRGKWDPSPKTGFIDITSSREFSRIYSGLQFMFCGEPIEESISNQQQFGDSVAWGGCTITYLLGQQLHFELFDFVYQMLNIAESESVTTAYPTMLERSKQVHYGQDLDMFLENAKKARRLNNHVFSMLKARCPLEDKMACAIKQSGAPVLRMKYSNTLSAFETLPQKARFMDPLSKEHSKLSTP
ncbi:protein PIR isoform X2 [Cryptomeria japonica]|uniref:protein PIR isoform X2 n=1 Tax=Cryptomeria japonica TaxID=3369 RepID=UPI0027D9E98F|nr:protein PIR isoform X2 [Cryptomeria japonica]